MTSAPRTAPARSRGFTLVELLVVIGIIAVLIGVLLPALSRARAQANTVKCMTQLREIGNALSLYANDNKGFWPIVRFETNLGFPQDPAIIQFRSPGLPNIYWYQFLLKYFKPKQEFIYIPGGARLLDFKDTPLYGCPVVDAEQFIASANLQEFNTGYGMGPYAMYTPNKYIGANSGPVAGAPSTFKGSHWAMISDASGQLNGRWLKQVQWTQAQERGIIADSRSWFLEIRSPGTGPNVTIPEQNMGPIGYDSAALDQFDRYRHGKRKGRVAFNVLFCDGHVATLQDIKQGYIAFRRHFPG
jgi:prepilin-type N-terminal cleavage/methylation domain-containing protein/prepilin-type processing-associated H-X9-DG protein